MEKQSSDDILIRRGLAPRIFHAVLFELIAITVTSLFLIIVTNQSLIEMGILSIIISVIATIWNGIFNFIYDRLQRALKFKRDLPMRILHAVVFEIGLISFIIPIIMFYLNIGFFAAFFLEAGLLAFFLPYSIFFNTIYDKIYIRFFGS